MVKFSLLPIFLVIISFQVKSAFAVNGSNRTATITLEFADSAFLQDTFVIRYWHNLLAISVAEYLPFKECSMTNDTGSIQFTINPVDDFGYFCISKNEQGKEKYLLYYYLFESGDDIRITMKKDKPLVPPAYIKRNRIYFSGFRNFDEYIPEFEGVGPAKYLCRFKMDSISYMADDTGIITEDHKYFKENSQDKINAMCLDILSGFKNKITRRSYYLLMADSYGKQELDKYWHFKWLVDSYLNKDSNGYHILKGIHNEGFKTLNEEVVPKNIQIVSPFYLESLFEYKRYSLLLQGLTTPKIVYQNISNNFFGLERERLLCLLLIAYRDRFESQFVYFNEIYSRIIDHSLKENLEYYSKKFVKGSKAFPFSFTNLEGQEVTLEHLKGHIVLIDLWYTGCGACVRFYKETLSDIENTYRDKRNYKFLSVSIDKNINTWLKSVNSNLYTSKDAINVYTNGEGSANEFIRHYNIKLYPTIIIIDSNSNLVGIYNKLSKDQIIEILNSVN